MKMSMIWHKECLRNVKASLQREEAALERLIIRVAQIREEMRVYEAQFQAAQDQGKDGFDADKFNQVGREKKDGGE